MKKLLLSISAGLLVSCSLFGQIIIGNCELGNVSQLGTYWYSYSAGLSTISQVKDGTFKMTKGGANGTDSAAIVTGKLVNTGGTIVTPGAGASTYESAGFGFPLTNGKAFTSAQTKNADSLAMAAALDLSGATGISFYHKGDAINFSVMLTTVAPNKGYDYSYTVDAHADWTLVTVPFTALSQASWMSVDAQTKWDASKACQLQWQIKDGDPRTYSYGIDQVTLIGATPVASITVDKPTASISSASGTAQITASVLPSTATFKAATYTVSDPKLASVSSTGLVTALADGTVTVTATAIGGLTAKSTIAISNQVAVTGITVGVLPTTSIIATALGTLQVTAIVLPTTASNKTVTYTVSDTAKASITTTGLVTAKANGTITVTVKAVGTVTATTGVITLSNQPVPVTSVVFALPSYTISTVGAKPTVVASVLPTTATNKTVTYSITPTTIAIIDAATGVITAKANGTATITATSGSKTVTAILTVTGQVDAPEVKLQTVVTQIDNSFTFVGTAKLVNVSGQVVATGVNTLDASSVPTGIYFIIVEGFAGKEVYIK